MTTLYFRGKIHLFDVTISFEDSTHAEILAEMQECSHDEARYFANLIDEAKKGDIYDCINFYCEVLDVKNEQ